MKQIDRLLIKVTATGKRHPIFAIFNNLTPRQLHKEESRVYQEHPFKEVVIVNIVSAKMPKKRNRQLRA